MNNCSRSYFITQTVQRERVSARRNTGTHFCRHGVWFLCNTDRLMLRHKFLSCVCGYGLITGASKMSFLRHTIFLCVSINYKIFKRIALLVCRTSKKIFFLNRFHLAYICPVYTVNYMHCFLLYNRRQRKLVSSASIHSGPLSPGVQKRIWI